MIPALFKQNPYVGPLPFEREDEDRFFGRDRESSELFSLTVAHRMFLIYAQSGAGKTSLINARLIPQLERDGFYVFPVARLQGPIAPLDSATSIRNIFIYNTLLSIAPSGNNPNLLLNLSLTEFLDQARTNMKPEEADCPQVLIFDQFEELFNLYLDRWEDRKGFFEQIRDAVERTESGRSGEHNPPLWVVFIMREDYIAQLDPYMNILPGKLRIRYRLERLQADAALLAITGPLRNSGRSFAPGVAEKLVEELLQVHVELGAGRSADVRGEFVEPVQLQLICQSLWQGLPNEVTEITEKHLVEFGNVDQVLARFYDKAVRSAAQKAQINESRLRAWCEGVLITSMGTRGTVYQGPEFTGNIPNIAINELENQHLIRAEFRAGARWYELTHDRFIDPIRASNREYESNIAGQSEKEVLRQQALLAVTHAEQAWGVGDYENALENYAKAQALYEKIGDLWGHGNTLASIGYIQLQAGNREQAILSLQQSLDLFNKSEDLNSAAKISTLLASMENFYEDKRDRVAATRMFGEFTKLRDSTQRIRSEESRLLATSRSSADPRKNVDLSMNQSARGSRPNSLNVNEPENLDDLNKKE